VLVRPLACYRSMFYQSDQTRQVDETLPDKHDLLTFKTSDEMLNSMYSLLKDELDRYLGFSNGTKP
jgi:hypothetical protein